MGYDTPKIDSIENAGTFDSSVVAIPQRYLSAGKPTTQE